MARVGGGPVGPLLCLRPCSAPDRAPPTSLTEDSRPCSSIRGSTTAVASRASAHHGGMAGMRRERGEQSHGPVCGRPAFPPSSPDGVVSPASHRRSVTPRTDRTSTSAALRTCGHTATHAIPCARWTPGQLLFCRPTLPQPCPPGARPSPSHTHRVLDVVQRPEGHGPQLGQVRAQLRPPAPP